MHSKLLDYRVYLVFNFACNILPLPRVFAHLILALKAIAHGFCNCALYLLYYKQKLLHGNRCMFAFALATISFVQNSKIFSKKSSIKRHRTFVVIVQVK